jgi:hypothetical protein
MKHLQDWYLKHFHLEPNVTTTVHTNMSNYSRMNYSMAAIAPLDTVESPNPSGTHYELSLIFLELLPRRPAIARQTMRHAVSQPQRPSLSRRQSPTAPFPYEGEDHFSHNHHTQS